MAHARFSMSQKTYLRGPLWLIPLALAVIVLALPFLGASPSTLRTIVSISLLTMLVLGLNLTFGFAGELALGQAAIYGAGAYAAGWFAVQGLDLPLTLVIAVIAAAVVGLITGAPGVRLGSWALAMVTFFLVIIFPDVISLIPGTGGAMGLLGIPLPTIFGQELDSTGFYLLVVILAIATVVLGRNLVMSRHGAAFKVMRESPTLARSLGISLPRLKLSAYLIGALPAGAAGALFAYNDGFVSPDSFSFHLAVSILAASVIGGSASIYGAIVGAAVLTIGPLQVSGFQDWSTILFGVLLLVAGLFFTGGLAGAVNKLIWQRFVRHDVLLPDVQAILANPDAGPSLQLEGRPVTVDAIVKDFGGNRALKGVSIETRPGTLTALIGPNGSGKTTLLNIISGFYRPTSGRVLIDGDDVTGLGATAVARRGVSRTFQTPMIPKGMRAAEVVASARYTRVRSSALANMVRWPSAVKANREDREQALRIMNLMGIAHLADRESSSLPLGTRRLLEVARALASSPALVLLDEPASGLDEAEVTALGDVLMTLAAQGANILIVEHNFEMITRIADTVHVLHLGEIIASGDPHAVRNDPVVVESYLGKKARAELELRLANERAAGGSQENGAGE